MDEESVPWAGAGSHQAPDAGSPCGRAGP
jgi:hypothetical protein